MRELDDLLLDYLQKHYDNATETDKCAFRTLLELPNPELIGYLLHKDQPAAEHASVIAHILDRTPA